MSVQSDRSIHFLVACPQCKRQFDCGELPPGARFHCSCGNTIQVPTLKAHETNVVRCSSCGAPRSRGTSSCGHCGSDYTLHERDLHTICPSCMTRISDRARYCHSCATPILPQGQAGRPTDYNCPVCGTDETLNSRAMGEKKIAVMECPKCAGLWLDRKIFRELTDRARESTASNELAPENATPPKPGRQQGPLYRRCPQCETMMHRCNFGKRSGVIIDRCREHGFWFDATELARILAWIRDGGEVMSRKRDRLEERQQRSAEKHLSVEKMWTSRYAQGQYTRTRSGGNDFAGIVSSLFDI